MKKISTLFLIFAIQVLIIVFVPNLTKSSLDKINLVACVSVYLLVFSFGLVKMLKIENISQSQFNAKYFGSMGLRMIIALSTIAIYLYISKIKNLYGSIFLVLSYFVYMGFEIRIILHKLRTDSEKSKNADNARK